MNNLAGVTDFAKQVQTEFLPLASGLGKCTGPSCNRPEPAEPVAIPLECYETSHAPDAPAVSL